MGFYVILMKCLYNSKIVENANKRLRSLSKHKKEIPDLCIPIKKITCVQFCQQKYDQYS